ncbi:cation efflux family protein [Haladaptatus paucihalophilus DX253]|uniref:Cation efflux family protein n=1 Tax=Haladaptatus paucihalophilus DX253 TaxID=797209 RepID=E7QPN1_HALPU|nr:cation diffusion facilitator family transporter [Haladaptatus paucihalophilus]EFW93447.1 cation efflux family protein [Haladaptatus paucihalophilus DX253]SHL19485.1 cobalt-zinc-cadmium efflux system protein [Haladaptatus paucihalophilus DX253]
MSDRSNGHGHDHDHDGHGHGGHGHGGHGHDHDGHGHGGHGGSGNRRALKIALVINTAFFVVEIAGALYANSLTLLADAGHMLTDSASIVLALFAAWIATLDADSKRTYGYQRAEILAALANGVFLVIIVVYVAYEAVMRFQNPQDVKALPTIVIGVVGLGANLAGAYVLHGGRDSLNVEGVYLHLLTDAAGSLAAIALGVGLYVSDLYVLDPIFSLVIAALVLYSAKDLLIESVNILLQGTPSSVDVDDITGTLSDLDGAIDVHDVHVWALTNRSLACSAHVVVADDADRDAVLDAARHALNERHDIGHATIQVESESGDCETADFDCYPANGGHVAD